MIIHSEQEMLDFGEGFAENVRNGQFEVVCDNGSKLASEPRDDGRERSGPRTDYSHVSVIELIGDVGAGKTTFVRGLAKGLNIKDPITSPSFTISKSYALPDGGNLVHYDFYRLSDPGIMLDDLQENLRDPKNIVVIEWGESVADILPENRTVIRINQTSNYRILNIE